MKMIKGLFLKKKTGHLLVYVIVLISIWTSVSIADILMNRDYPASEMLILNVPDMLLFHRVLFMLIALLFTSFLLHVNTRKMLIKYQQDLKNSDEEKLELFSIIHNLLVKDNKDIEKGKNKSKWMRN